MTQRKNALITGLSLLLMAVTAGYAYGYALSELYVKGNAEATLLQTQKNPSLVIGAIIGWVIILALDLIVSWTLYQFYAAVSKKKSAIMGILRVGYSVILAVAIYYLTQVIPAANAEDQALVYRCFQYFDQVWLLGLIVFGLHLLVLGLLVLDDPSIHNLFGWLLLMGGISYSFISSMKTIYGETLEWVLQTEMVMSVPMAFAELALAVWMLVKGGKQIKKGTSI